MQVRWTGLSELVVRIMRVRWTTLNQGALHLNQVIRTSPPPLAQRPAWQALAVAVAPVLAGVYGLLAALGRSPPCSLFAEQSAETRGCPPDKMAGSDAPNCAATMRLQFSRNFSLEILNLYWDSLPFRGGFIFSLRINWKRIVSYEQDIEMPRHAPDAH
eukprot:COSAG03_NODE_8890_length_762_cov_1.328808_2_plen_158_part_01